LLIFLNINNNESPMNIPNPRVGNTAIKVPKANPTAIEWGEGFYFCNFF